jgi:hypothetical protein
MNMDGASGTQLHTPPWGSLTVGVVFPREMTCVWTLLQAHTKGLKVGGDGIKDVAGEFILSLHRSLEDLATRFLCSTAFRGRLENFSLICILFGLSLFLYSFPLSDFVAICTFARVQLKMCFHRSAHSSRSTGRNGLTEARIRF